MRIDSLTTSNFKALAGRRNYEDLPDGIIGIVGDNGQGKSTLMSAVAYAFYGPEVLDTGLADVVTWGQNAAQVGVTFSLDGHRYTGTRSFERGTSKAFLFRDDEQITNSPTVVTDEITKLLGIDRVGFLASVFSKQEDLLGIGSLQPAKRATTVLRLLQMDKIESGLKTLSETIRDLNREVSALRLVPAPVTNVDYRKEIERAQGRVLNLTAKRDGYLLGVDAETRAIREIEGQVAEYNDYAGKANTLTGVIASAKETVRDAFNEVDQTSLPEPTKPDRWIDPEEFLEHDRELKSLRESVARSICPTCKRPYVMDEAEKVRARVVIMENLVRDERPVYEGGIRYQKAVDQYERSVEQRKSAQERAENAMARLDRAKGELEALPKVDNPSKPYNAALQRRRELEVNLFSTDSMLATERNDIRHWTEAMDRYEGERNRYAQTELRIKELEHGVLVNGQTQLLMQQYKTALIANVIPTITERASSLITEMTEGKYTELALTPQYDIEYRNDRGDLKSFANLSGGEKDVFALALRLAIADLKAGSIGILVLDEVLESLDPGRQESTWEALERLTNRYNQIFVITHVDTFKDRAPYSIVV